MDITELLLHPVRLRIMHAVLDGRPFSTSQLCERLPDISTATLYRQVALLVDGGLLNIERETRVRGAVERIYRLQPAKTAMTPEAISAMTKDDHRRGFAAAIAMLVGEFNAYLDREDANPLADSVSYRQFALWLSDAEKDAFIEEIVIAIRARVANVASPERRRHLLSTILFPTEPS
ncbi:helix-turn-helix domain-containing protein [Rhizobium sp. 60-20]|uniref:helix-turn-helix domain-containing protein n=1 Tax=Rhizobium sp. 60-20 TaxID=1895819 RepID=UPI00092ACC14|nr:helix-turn-helix domain-containing protein [Rhizobium sp. 60-20]MBN8949875.1 helix-turn-helix domain-containing protein [Rhizobium tropici]OJY62745.1 MAG: ArsR family transcriptional regulator [Rhizobium sp. 60-20]